MFNSEIQNFGSDISRFHNYLIIIEMFQMFGCEKRQKHEKFWFSKIGRSNEFFPFCRFSSNKKNLNLNTIVFKMEIHLVSCLVRLS